MFDQSWHMLHVKDTVSCSFTTVKTALLTDIPYNSGDALHFYHSNC